MRKVLIGAAFIGLLLFFSYPFVPTVVSQGQQCGGSFVPSMNCRIAGLWNFVNSAGPFQINGTTVAVTAADLNATHYATITLTNTQVLALNTTAVTVISAPAAGYVLEPIGGMLLFNYTGAYTVGAGDDLRLWYTDRYTGPAASNVIETNGFLTATADATINFTGVPTDELTGASPVAITIQNTSGVVFGGGNAANTLTVQVAYRLHQTGF